MSLTIKSSVQSSGLLPSHEYIIDLHPEQNLSLFLNPSRHTLHWRTALPFGSTLPHPSHLCTAAVFDSFLFDLGFHTGMSYPDM